MWPSSEGIKYGVVFMSVELNGETKAGDRNLRVTNAKLT